MRRKTNRERATHTDARAPLASGLRTRFKPTARIHGALIFVAPWLDLLLVMTMFALFNGVAVLKPGVVVELPVAPFRDGVSNGMVAVVLSIDRTPRNGGMELVFFDDEPFRVGVEGDMKRLRHALASAALRRPWAPLVIQADKAVRHGTVTMLVRLASEAGVAETCLAMRAE